MKYLSELMKTRKKAAITFLVQVKNIKASGLRELFEIIEKYNDPVVTGSINPNQTEILRYSINDISGEKLAELKSELESANISGYMGIEN